MPVSRGMDELVNRAVLRWRAEQDTAARLGAPLATQRQRPTIAVSREAGALGATVAELAAALLGFQVYDRDLVGRIAEQANARKALVETLDERVQDRVSDTILPLFQRGRLADGEYLRSLMQVLLALGRHGRGIIVGRAATLVLDPERTLRVRLFAPLAVRAERLAAQRAISPQEARTLAVRLDHERADFISRFFRRDVADADLYDLLLNTGTITPEGAADLVTAAFRQRFPAD